MKNKMQLGSVVTLDNDIKYLVSNITIYNDITYYLLVDTNELSNFMIVYQTDSDEIESVEDQNLLERLILLMTKDMLK